MNWRGREPRLAEILADPIVQAIMAADGVDPQQLLATLRKTAAIVVRQPRERESEGFERRKNTTRSMRRAASASSTVHTEKK